jgi:transposase
MTTAEGVPIAVTLTEANQHELRQLMALVLLRFPRVGGCPGRPLEKPRSVRADKGYDCQATRVLLKAVGITPHIPRRGEPDEDRLGAYRWPVERAISWLKQFRRLRIRWDRLSHIHQAFLDLACSLIAWRQLNLRTVLS